MIPSTSAHLIVRSEDVIFEFRGGSRIFLGGCALVSCSTSTPINHIVFFFAEYQVVLENRRSSQGCGGGDGVRTPLHPPPRSAPGVSLSYKTVNTVVSSLYH